MVATIRITKGIESAAKKTMSFSYHLRCMKYNATRPALIEAINIAIEMFTATEPKSSFAIFTVMYVRIIRPTKVSVSSFMCEWGA